MGAIAVPIDPHLTETEIDNLIQDCTPLIIVCSSSAVRKLKQRVCQNSFIQSIILLDVKEEAILEEKTLSFHSLFQGADSLPELEVVEEDPAAIMYISGTTGHPKGGCLNSWEFHFWMPRAIFI